MNSRHLSTRGLTLLIALGALLLASDLADAGIFRRCRVRRLRCRRQVCRPVRETEKAAMTEQKFCRTGIIEQIFDPDDPKLCVWATYSGVICPGGEEGYWDDVCSLGYDPGCSDCSCGYCDGTGQIDPVPFPDPFPVPDPGPDASQAPAAEAKAAEAKKKPLRYVSPKILACGVPIDAIVKPGAGYEQLRPPKIATLKINGHDTRLIELIQISTKKAPGEVVGIGHEVSQGQPSMELRRTKKLSDYAYTARVARVGKPDFYLILLSRSKKK